MQYPKMITVLLTVIAVTGCEGSDNYTSRHNNSTMGNVDGSNGLLGGDLGDEVDEFMDENDQQAYWRASQNAMETGSTKVWRNARTGHHGTIIPSKKFENENGQYCRAYTQTIYIDGERHKAQETACRDEDNGMWQIIE